MQKPADSPYVQRMTALLEALEAAESDAEKQLVRDQMAETTITMLKPRREPTERNFYERDAED